MIVRTCSERLEIIFANTERNTEYVLYTGVRYMIFNSRTLLPSVNYKLSLCDAMKIFIERERTREREPKRDNRMDQMIMNR